MKTNIIETLRKRIVEKNNEASSIIKKDMTIEELKSTKESLEKVKYNPLNEMILNYVVKRMETLK